MLYLLKEDLISKFAEVHATAGIKRKQQRRIKKWKSKES